MNPVNVITHPLVQHHLTRLRDKRIEPQEFRRVMNQITALMVYEATRSLRSCEMTVETPLEATIGSRLERDLVLVPILRAGLGMLGPVLEMLPHCRVGFLGVKRDEATLLPTCYHQSLPPNLDRSEVILIDPMLATGGSAVAALDFLVQAGARQIRLVNLLVTRDGIDRVQTSHPGVRIYTAAIDRQLNAHGYILPGLGDAGDRLFGT
jgi:uracil phosphoribosyltransferase